ncbi:MAG: Gfo/Idh/MocA family oxidoreductase [Chitinophagaceae bacterium]|nr:Gfo/Idh/MocA family oxidoreductase [Chitinophagaceae bacterium]
MKSNRRDFLRLSGLAGISLVPPAFAKAGNGNEVIPDNPFKRDPAKHFNMCGYAAPRLDTVRIGFVGLGQRGPDAVLRMSKIEGVEIKALCDLRTEKAEAAKASLKGTKHTPDLYHGDPEAWKKMVDRNDLDLIYIATPWALHTPQAVYAMKAGKHVCTEVPAAKTIDECWQLVETSEATKKHCMMLENCCFDFFELLTLNMVRQGLFGEIVHAEGAYIHDLVHLNFDKDGYYDMWRLKENFRKGDLYPTHGLGPIAQAMNINRGDKMEYLTSISTNDFTMAPHAKELAEKDDFFKPYANKTFRGNMNTTVVRTTKGKTIMIQHDVSSPRIYSRIHLVSGTKGAALKYPEPGRINFGHEKWVSEEEMKALEQKYQPPIVTKVGELAKQIGGHGGMDFLMDWRTIDCLRNGLPLEMDVYDAATWSCIAPLSEQSVAKRSSSVDVPDFTSNSWKTNKPVEVTTLTGGTTKVIA